MALHTELPIYKVAYDLLQAITGLPKNMPREFKVMIGSKLRDEAAEVINAIFKANVSNDKERHLLSLLRLASDMHWISTKQYAQAIIQTVSIGKQANGWRRKHKSSVA